LLFLPSLSSSYEKATDGAISWTNPHPLMTSCPFPSFLVVSLCRVYT